MESIKRFLLEEKASSEAVSSVVLIAMAALLLSVGLGIYWGAFETFFTAMGTWMASITPPPAT